MKYLQTLFLFLISCSSEPKSNIIFIEISPVKLMLQNEEIERGNFEKELKAVIDFKSQQGFRKEELVVELKVDKQTLRGEIADLEIVLRRLNVRKIIYSTLDEAGDGIKSRLIF